MMNLTTKQIQAELEKGVILGNGIRKEELNQGLDIYRNNPKLGHHISLIPEDSGYRILVTRKGETYFSSPLYTDSDKAREVLKAIVPLVEMREAVKPGQENIDGLCLRLMQEVSTNPTALPCGDFYSARVSKIDIAGEPYTVADLITGNDRVYVHANCRYNSLFIEPYNVFIEPKK